MITRVRPVLTVTSRFCGQVRDIFINNMQVKTIELDKNCKACMAAKSALESNRYVLSKAVKKVKDQSQAILSLQIYISKLEAELASE